MPQAVCYILPTSTILEIRIYREKKLSKFNFVFDGDMKKAGEDIKNIPRSPFLTFTHNTHTHINTNTHTHINTHTNTVNTEHKNY